MIMLIAGYETTANTITLLAYCAATEPEVQEKLYKEILETKEKYVSKFLVFSNYRCNTATSFYWLVGVAPPFSC